jgi:ribosomal protein S18 acetylase RimI-like enzyme
MEAASLEVVPAGPGRDEVIDLLLLADESPAQVAGYLHEGDLFVLRDGAGAAVALTLVRYPDGTTAELKAVAVRPERQGHGVGKGMLTQVLERLRAAGRRRVLVATGASSLGPLALYQKLGFRPFRIERDVFTPERGYPAAIVENGIRLLDVIWLDLDLDADRDRAPGIDARADA